VLRETVSLQRKKEIDRIRKRKRKTNIELWEGME
jgi:hypothetical protein